jgi:hypothetical protein
MATCTYGSLYGLLCLPDDAKKIVRTPEDALTHARFSASCGSCSLA